LNSFSLSFITFFDLPWQPKKSVDGPKNLIGLNVNLISPPRTDNKRVPLCFVVIMNFVEVVVSPNLALAIKKMLLLQEIPYFFCSALRESVL
jgi:hypothetical protein